jgi:hypothetical protein
MHMHNFIIIYLTQDILSTSFYANTFDPQKRSKVNNNNNNNNKMKTKQ